jgi:formiminoglutamase
MALSHDPLWIRAGAWLAAGEADRALDVGVLGIPAFETSLSPTQAHTTPDAIRAALLRYSTFAGSAGSDLQSLQVADLGTVVHPDGLDGEERTRQEVRGAVERTKLLVCLGGDNSITFPIAQGAGADAVITFDAHHDVREGASNGSPIRRLIEAGIPGTRIVQIGIADFANSKPYSQWARNEGINVIPLDEVHAFGMTQAVSKALDWLSAASRIHVDVDMDVCDRSVAPACPASLPGGLSAHQLLLGVQAVVQDARVRTLDIAEVDAEADTADQRTVRLAAMVVLRAMLALTQRQ